jgi:LPS sulfotransferase NodH
MILGSARTGSNLLVSLLSAHPNIKIYGELFNLDSLTGDMLSEALEDPIAYMRRRAYGEQQPGTTAVGFKMFYDHLTADYFNKPVRHADIAPDLQRKFLNFSTFIHANYDWNTLSERFRAMWEFLRADQSLAVIHLKRRNLLDTLISLKRAYMTRQWWCLTTNSAPAPLIRLDTDECVNYFDTVERCAAEADMAFETHPKVDLLYEDLSADQLGTLQRVFTLLDVPSHPVCTRMRKQSLAPAAESVENYSELKRHFQDTRWAHLF